MAARLPILAAAMIAAAATLLVTISGGSGTAGATAPAARFDVQTPTLAPAASPARTVPVHRAMKTVVDIGHGNKLVATWTSNTTGAPWAMLVHGGYWTSGAGYTGSSALWAQHEQKLGIVAFTVDYRLVPTVTWPAPLTDVETGIAYVRSHPASFGINVDRGFLIGGSAGGLLSDIAALSQGTFAGAISISGVADSYQAAFDPRQKNARLKSSAIALHGGVMPWKSYKTWATSRAKNYINPAKKTPFLLVASKSDHTVNISMSDDFAAALRAKKFTVEYHRVPGATHSYYALAWPYEDTFIAGVLHGSIR